MYGWKSLLLEFYFEYIFVKRMVLADYLYYSGRSRLKRRPKYVTISYYTIGDTTSLRFVYRPISIDFILFFKAQLTIIFGGGGDYHHNLSEYFYIFFPFPPSNCRSVPWSTYTLLLSLAYPNCIWLMIKLITQRFEFAIKERTRRQFDRSFFQWLFNTVCEWSPYYGLHTSVDLFSPRTYEFAIQIYFARY